MVSQAVYIQARPAEPEPEAPIVHYRAEWFRGQWYAMACEESGFPHSTAAGPFLFEHEAKAATRKLNGELADREILGTLRMAAIAAALIVVWVFALRAMELL